MRFYLNSLICSCLATFIFACEGSDQDETGGTSVSGGTKELSAGEMEAGEAGVAGSNTAGDVAAGSSEGREAGDEASEAGTLAAGEEIGGGAEAGTEGGETTGGEVTGGDVPAGEEAGTDTAGDIIIDVVGEGGEEWVDPVDFGPVGEGIHAFTMTDINGEEVDMRRYRGRVALVVNVASRCGYTRQYEDLQNLYSEYRERGLVILGFPANNFGRQEPGTDEEIAEFCSATYGVTFPMFSKISVKGADIHPLYAYLTAESGREVSWNFNKFLVGRDGHYIEHFLSDTEPYGSDLIVALEAALAE